MGKRTKLCAYVKNGDLKRLKSYFRKHKRDTDILSMKIDDNGRSALHLASKHMKADIVKYLLKQKVNALMKDDKGNVPLMYAMKNHRQHTGYLKIISQLVDFCPEALTVANKNGLTAGDILRGMEQKFKKPEEPQNHHTSDNDDDSSWHEKLQDECMNEYETEWGTYEDDFYSGFREPESYDTWAGRLASEYRRKKTEESYAFRNARGESTDNNKNSSETWNAEKQKKFEEKCRLEEEMRQARKAERKLKRLVTKKRDYESQCRHLFGAEFDREVIVLDNLPETSEDFVDILLSDLSSDPVEMKRYLREQQIRWHPDRFYQKCDARLQPDDKPDILERVKQLSQAINSHLERYSSQKPDVK